MHITDRIEMNPKVMVGKPVIRRTWITVELILRKLSEGASIASLLDAYPRLTREDIQAAIGYAANSYHYDPGRLKQIWTTIRNDLLMLCFWQYQNNLSYRKLSTSNKFEVW